MLAVLHSLGMFIIDVFKSRRRLEAENLFLRPQLGIAFLDCVAVVPTANSKRLRTPLRAIDLCVVPTLTFECLFAFLVLGHGRRQLLWFAVTRHPAEWLVQQIVEAFPWGTVPISVACGFLAGTAATNTAAH